MTYLDIIMCYLDLVIEAYEKEYKLHHPGVSPGQFHIELRTMWNKAKGDMQ
jgi:hypothetical protein